MQQYELAIFVDPGLTSEKQKELIAKLEKLVEAEAGTVHEKKEWGRRELAYPIKKQKAAFGWLLRVEMSRDKIAVLEASLKKEAEIVRYLVTKSEVVEKAVEAKPKAEPKKAKTVKKAKTPEKAKKTKKKS